MARFSDSEKEVIKERLKTEGERLFIEYGVKKVTVDELVKAAGIAKGSFYVFFPGKEQLFIEIMAETQKKIWAEMDDFLLTSRRLPPREMVKQAFLLMLGQLDRYPLIKKVDKETMDYLSRKLPTDVLEASTVNNGFELSKLEKQGVRFTCGKTMAAKILQALTSCFFNLARDDEANRDEIMNTILNGVLSEIVAERSRRLF